MDGFTMHVNDMESICEVLKYVDDTTSHEILDYNSPEKSRMQHNLDVILNWTTHNEMVINSDKTKEMIVCSPKKSGSQT